MSNPARLCDEHFVKLLMSQLFFFTNACKAEGNKCFINPQKWYSSKNNYKWYPYLVTQQKLFCQAHERILGGHLGNATVYSELLHLYWWPKITSDITHWCTNCLTCATYGRGQMVCPPLTPIPVSGPFDQVGIDVIKFPQSKKGNQCAVIL